MGFLDEDTRATRAKALESADQGRRAKLDADIQRFIDPENLAELVDATKSEVLHAYRSSGRVKNVRVRAPRVTSLLRGDETCEDALLTRLKVIEPSTVSVELLLVDARNDEFPHVRVTFDPPLT